MNRNCLSPCFATMRLLLKVSHAILQLFTIIARFISFNLPNFVTYIYKPCISIYVSDGSFFICDCFGNSCDPNQYLSVARIFCRFCHAPIVQTPSNIPKYGGLSLLKSVAPLAQSNPWLCKLLSRNDRNR